MLFKTIRHITEHKTTVIKHSLTINKEFIGYIEVEYLTEKNYKKYYYCLKEYVRLKEDCNPELPIDILQRRYQSNYEWFIRFYYNKPTIKYSYVGPNYRGKGYGLKLYIFMFEWLTKHKLPMWGSNIQSSKAKKIWKILKKEYKEYFFKEGTRSYLWQRTH